MRIVGDLSSASIGAFSCLMKLFHGAAFFNFPLHLHRTAGLEIGRHRWGSSVWWLLHGLYAIVCSVMAKFDYNCLYQGLETTDTMNNYFRFVIGMVTAFVTLGDSWCSVGRHRAIWKSYRGLAHSNGTYLGLLDRSRTAATARCILKTFVVIVATWAVIQYKAFSTLMPGTQWQCFWVYNIYPVTMSYLRHVFHLIHIGLMSENLSQLRTKLDHLSRTVGDSLQVENITLNPRKHEAAVRSTIANLEHCRSIYTELWRANEGINELFGFSQAFNVACSFVQIAFDLYWVRAMWISGEPDIDLQLLLFVPTPLIMGYLMHTISRYHRAVESVKQAVLEMPCMHDARMVQLRGHFLGQLQRFRLRLTARNVFEFDNTLLPKFAFVIVTYILIFVEINRS